jgi:hypothetical protein
VFCNNKGNEMCLNDIKISLQEAEDCLYNVNHDQRLISRELSELEIALAHCLVLIEKVIEETTK